ncbi:DNA-binding winged helix-turn-helix (wHTH) domain-containing protein [Novosphingobium sp. CF614]|uniref:protein kinase domain-containing protein n=1 Tax=Novosphingobium sp. CF614 TaxID=1884364 RepID=UPI0008F0A36E|nr:winged helix-turn-helix domain-containing protein [Novosphingobium sp. CF614]SFG40988.1 DNA-binding winged helix-turn-helix (wHTH) domain-containing protein [Novosphingobium sp. CF614]
MATDSSLQSSSRRSDGQRLWTFGNCTIDETNRLLTIGGVMADLEAKPFDILLELLHHAGEVVTKDELLDAVWPNVTVAEGSLTTALSKLRRTIGDTEGVMIVTVPRLGYRFAAPVSVTPSAPQAPVLAIEAGAAVPGRTNWHYAERLGHSPHAEVWRIAHDKTRDTRVLKLAADASRLCSLKREVAVARLLRESLGERADFVTVLDWNFSEAPFFIESADGGANFADWAAAQGGLASVPMALRIELVAQVASTVAAAHGLGVLHKDLKPDNVLVSVDRNGRWQSRVIDFGSAVLTQPERFDVLGITNTATGDAMDGAVGGTTPWIAPELFAGEAPGMVADIYALGVILYQVVIGDLRRPLATGWEAHVGDPLLRADIADATIGDPAKRLESAAELARRLHDLDGRRREADAAKAAAMRAQLAEAKMARVRARRPWMIAATLALLLGTSLSVTLAMRAARERDNALHQTRIADSINGFLANDLLARSNPFRSASAGESFVDVVKQASPLIDRRFAAEPAIAARLHQTIANAFDKRSDWVEARIEYDRAAALWAKAGSTNATDAIINRLQRAMMEARSYQDGSPARAQSEIDRALPEIGALAHARPDVAVWLASARGMAALVNNDIKKAQEQFDLAVQDAGKLPQLDPIARLTFRQRLAFTKIRLGDGPGAEHDFRALARDYAAIEGPDGPNVLMTRMNLTQALTVGHDHEGAIAEASALYPRLAARLGEDHEMTLQLLTTKAQSEGMIERWADAIRDDLRVHELAAKKLGSHAFFTIASLTDAATAQCRSGQAAQGLANAEQAYRDAVAGFGKVALADAIAYTVAECDIDLGRTAEAAARLEGIDAAAVAQLAGDADWGANVRLAWARIAEASGHKDAARQELEAVRAVYTAKSAEPYQARTWRDLMRKVS